MAQLLVRSALFVLSCVSAFAAPPRIFFSDLESGPATGGQNDAGVFVTIHGTRFGASRGTSYISIGKGRAAAYLVWTDTKVSFQIGSGATSGNIVITTPGGPSNGIPFTVRGGNIYFVAPNGSDSNNGSFAKPWKSLLKARDTIQAGDTVYAMDGVSQLADDGSGWRAAMLIRGGGAPDAPKALVAYPGATVTLGTVNGPSYAIRTADNGASTGHWVFAGLTLRALNGALILGGPSTNWRIVGNDLSCPNGDGEVGCLATGRATNLKIFGNNLHHAGKATASSHYHGLYLSTDSNHSEVAWNTVAFVRGCRGIQIHSSPLGPGGAADPTGHNIFDLSLHDNVIHDTQCDGIILATVDPSQGKVEVYNNIIYNAGTGPNNPERTGYWSCIMVNGSTANGPAGGGTVEIFSNTLYNCGAHTSPPYPNAVTAIGNGGNNPNLKIRIRNNIIVQPRGVPYLTIFGTADGIQGTNNLFYGNGAPAANPNVVKSVVADPQFVNLAGQDFHLSAGSPARRAGVDTGMNVDKEGRTRGGSAGFDLGALQYAAADVSSVSCYPPVVRAPGNATCTINLEGEAPEGGLEVAISSDVSGVRVPQQVAVPAGACWATFSADAIAVAGRTSALVSASFGDTRRSTSLWLFPANDASPLVFSLVNAASLLAGPVAPGELVAAFGAGMGADTRALFDDVPAPLLMVEPNQVNAMVPMSVAGKTDVRLEIEAGGLRSNPLALAVVSTAPGIFAADASGQGQAAAVNEDQTLNSSSNPARADTALAFYAAGLGETDSAGLLVAGVRATIGGVDAEVLGAGLAPGVPGLYQVLVRIPGGMGRNPAVPVLVAAAGNLSQPSITIAVE